MADTRRDDPHAPSITEGEASHEIRPLPVATQTAREDLPAIPDQGHGEEHDIARTSTPQTKGPSDGDGGAKNWNALANVVVSQGPEEEDQGGFTAASTPIAGHTGQGPPSFAQSEFYTVNLNRIPTIVVLIIGLLVRVDCSSSTP